MTEVIVSITQGVTKFNDFYRVAFLPLAEQPNLNPDHLSAFLFRHCHNQPERPDQPWAAFSARHYRRQGVFFAPRRHKQLRHEWQTSWYWDPLFQKTFPSVVDWVESLPWLKLTWVVLMRQVQPVFLHKDRGEWEDLTHVAKDLKPIEPSGYRVILPDENVPETFHNSFYVAEKFKESSKVHVNFQNGNFAFHLNETRYWHGADFHSGSNKLTLYMTGFLEPKAHMRLVRRSWSQNYDQAIVFPDTDPPSFRGNFLEAGRPTRSS